MKEKKSKHKSSSEESTNKSTPFSEEDSDVEALAKLYEEKYVSIFTQLQINNLFNNLSQIFFIYKLFINHYINHL